MFASIPVQDKITLEYAARSGLIDSSKEQQNLAVSGEDKEQGDGHHVCLGDHTGMRRRFSIASFLPEYDHPRGKSQPTGGALRLEQWVGKDDQVQTGRVPNG